jgi:hypothetical protein
MPTFWGGAARVSAILHAWLLTRSDGPWRVHHEVPVHGPETGRIDVWALRVSWSRLEAWAFECKVDRGDFKRDVDAGKWRKYLSSCSRFYWVCPEGLIKKEEVPEGTGLMYVGGGVRVVVRPHIREWHPNWMQMASLLFSMETPLFTDEDRYHRTCKPDCRVASHDVRHALHLDRFRQKQLRREEKRKLVETYANELKGKAAALRNVEQLKADKYKIERLMDIVRNDLGLWGTITEDQLTASLRQAKVGDRQVTKHLEALARSLGYKVEPVDPA